MVFTTPKALIGEHNCHDNSYKQKDDEGDCDRNLDFLHEREVDHYGNFILITPFSL